MPGARERLAAFGLRAPRRMHRAPPTLPPGWRLLPPPRGPRLLLPTSRPPLVSFTFDFTLESPRDPRATAGRQPKGVAGVRLGRGSWTRIDTKEDTVARAAAAWRRLAPTGSQPQRCVCQALPGDWMEGVQPDKLWCRRMACVDELWVLKLRDQRGPWAACHTSSWLGRLLAARWAPSDHDEHYYSAPCCTATQCLENRPVKG
ncbi:uncharacterized protein LOC115937766 [Leptonychotes weddellii]|uniref:Uncharacterized protein LOC115937766 n=1 Tax=Leptonychotes weddellii TaxID=9713 RepID=A0A7F8Q537_LEPWE|nr:uncharacterized protein LOC115937766 [Leptonychotes weddellii]